RNVHGPVAGAADVAGTARFKRLIGADHIADMVGSGVPRIHGFAKLVLETLSGEKSPFLGDPFPSPEMRRDHGFSPGWLSLAVSGLLPDSDAICERSKEDRVSPLSEERRAAPAPRPRGDLTVMLLDDEKAV